MLAHFETHGWVRVPNAFSDDDAAAMRDVVWRALAERGCGVTIHARGPRDDRPTCST